MRDMTPAPFLNVAVIQSDIHWEDTKKNLGMFSEKLRSISEQPDLIILPEMFNTGFTMNVKKYNETMSGKTMEWLEQMAKATGCVITGSLIIKEKKNYYNRLIWMLPDGKFQSYDKRHLFRMMDEDKFFTGGGKRIIAIVKGWNVCPLVCYDLRFPVWCRNRMVKESSGKKVKKGGKPVKIKLSHEYDLMVVIANWPEVRRYPWRILLQARAIENQCYVIGVNRVGVDGNGVRFSGNSEVIEPRGQTISSLKPYIEGTEVIKLPHEDLVAFRENFPVGLDADNFKIIIQ